EEEGQVDPDAPESESDSDESKESDESESESDEEYGLTDAPSNVQPSGHYALINNFDAMMFKYNDDNRSKLFCSYCFAKYPNTPQGAERRKQHELEQLCQQHDAVKSVLPKKDNNILQFTNYKN